MTRLDTQRVVDDTTRIDDGSVVTLSGYLHGANGLVPGLER